MSAYAAQAGIRSASLGLVVTRCGCGNPARHVGVVCPTPRAVEDLGVVAYWHRNPLKRLAWRIKQYFKE